jgi:hypothetical protein
MVATFTTLKPRGRPFPKGMKKTVGRAKGSKNLHTRAIREMIEAAAEGLGGTARLITWAMESEINERLFWTSIWPRLLPLQIVGAGARGEIEVNVKLSREEMMKRLIERGLPTSFFGRDKPLLELKTASPEQVGASSGAELAPLRISNGNGHDGEGGDGDGAMGGA